LSGEKRIGDEVIELEGIAESDGEYLSSRQTSRCGSADAVLGAV
jgi:hypothetical protein